MKKTILHDQHREILKAKMAPFAGFMMPLQYTSAKEEISAVRNAAGIFDVSHMGEFMVRGPQALDLIQKTTSNDASKLFDGKIQYSCFPNADGGIVDDLLVYRKNDKEYMLVVNASNLDKDWNWLQKHNDFDCELENISENITLLAVQGPKAVEVLDGLTDIDLAGMKYYTFAEGTFAGCPNILISATGYTGAGGFEIYIPNKHADTIWSAVFESGKNHGIQPIGLAARDTLRL